MNSNSVELDPAELSARDTRIAEVLAPLGNRPMTEQQARRAAQLLGMHWTSVYRLRRRFVANPVTSSVAHQPPGPKPGDRRLDLRVERIIQETFEVWLPQQRELAHPQLDVVREIRRRCAKVQLPAPSRKAVVRRWQDHRAALELDLALDPEALIAPGHLVSTIPMGLVQIDHTLADVFVVDEVTRKKLKRPWLSVAIDIASRCVVGFYLSMERPNSATVALLLTRIALPKEPWLAMLGLEFEWPMRGIPGAFHLDNAAEFRGRALKSGCAHYNIELQYRPVRRPHFGGHVERVLRTLLERMRGLPGATGSSPKGRKARNPEAFAAMTLRELEQWLAVEIGQRYHHAEHRGLSGATPWSAWKALADMNPPLQLPGSSEEAMRFVVRFLPLVNRTVQRDGLTFMRLHYWHPIFAAWREQRRAVTVRYHPEDLSRVFVSANGRSYFEARFADVRRPPISAWEHRQACRHLRTAGHRSISEALIFQAIEKQRQIVTQATALTGRAKRSASRVRDDRPMLRGRPPAISPQPSAVDYSKPAAEYPVEQW